MCARIRYSERTHNRRAGFTVTEVVVASALLAVAIVPILKALTVAYVTSAAIEQKSQSLIYAQQKLDEIRLRCVYDYDTAYTANNVAMGSSYFCNVQDTSAGSDLRTITVSVGYDSNGNGTLSSSEILVELPTLIARRY